MCVCKGVQVFWCMFVSVLVGGGVLFWFYLNVISCFSHHHQPTLPLFVIRCCFTLFFFLFFFNIPPKLKSKQKHSLSVSPISLSSSQLHICTYVCINQHTYTKKTGEFIKTRKCFAFYFEPLFFFFARRQNKQIKENFSYKNIFFLQVYLVHIGMYVCMQVRLCERLNWFKFIHFVSSKCSYLNISLDFALWQSSFFVVPYGGNMRAPLRARGST